MLLETIDRLIPNQETINARDSKIDSNQALTEIEVSAGASWKRVAKYHWQGTAKLP